MGFFKDFLNDMAENGQKIIAEEKKQKEEEKKFNDTVKRLGSREAAHRLYAADAKAKALYRLENETDPETRLKIETRIEKEIYDLSDL